MKASVLKFLFPSRCACCGAVIGETGVCGACRSGIRFILPPSCPVCAVETRLCNCGKRKRAYSHVVAPMYYWNKARDGIKRFKFQGKIQAGRFFAGEMQKVVEREYAHKPINLICSIPLSKVRMKERGYNQAHILANHLSKGLQIPFAKNALIKCRENEQQHLLSREMRLQNIQGVFAADNNIVTGKTILLADDIFTTGVTMNESASVLLEAGALAVYCVVAAVGVNYGLY